MASEGKPEHDPAVPGERPVPDGGGQGRKPVAFETLEILGEAIRSARDGWTLYLAWGVLPLLAWAVIYRRLSVTWPEEDALYERERKLAEA